MENNIKLRIMDDLLAEGVHIPSPDVFVRLVNQNLPPGERKIRKDALNKLIKKLRELIKNKRMALIHTPEGGYRYLRSDIRYFDDRISESERNLLLIANSLFSVFPGSGMNEQFSVAVNKILKKQNRKGEVHDMENFSPVYLGPMQKDSGAIWLPKIVASMMDCKFGLEVEYFKQKEGITKRVLSPYIIKQYASSWYLVAYDHFTEQVEKTKVFKLSRIVKIEESNTRFKHDPDFSVENYFKYTIGILHRHKEKPIKTKIQVISDHFFETWKESPLHSSQRIIDEKVRIIEIETYNTSELYSLLLRYGPSIKVLGPSEVINEIKKKMATAAKYY
jgi:hypothetical protein